MDIIMCNVERDEKYRMNNTPEAISLIYKQIQKQWVSCKIMW